MLTVVYLLRDIDVSAYLDLFGNDINLQN